MAGGEASGNYLTSNFSQAADDNRRYGWRPQPPGSSLTRPAKVCADSDRYACILGVLGGTCNSNGGFLGETCKNLWVGVGRGDACHVGVGGILGRF